MWLDLRWFIHRLCYSSNCCLSEEGVETKASDLIISLFDNDNQPLTAKVKILSYILKLDLTWVVFEIWSLSWLLRLCFSLLLCSVHRTHKEIKDNTEEMTRFYPSNKFSITCISLYYFLAPWFTTWNGISRYLWLDIYFHSLCLDASDKDISLPWNKTNIWTREVET